MPTAYQGLAYAYYSSRVSLRLLVIEGELTPTTYRSSPCAYYLSIVSLRLLFIDSELTPTAYFTRWWSKGGDRKLLLDSYSLIATPR